MASASRLSRVHPHASLSQKRRGSKSLSKSLVRQFPGNGSASDRVSHLTGGSASRPRYMLYEDFTMEDPIGSYDLTVDFTKRNEVKSSPEVEKISLPGSADEAGELKKAKTVVESVAESSGIFSRFQPDIGEVNVSESLREVFRERVREKVPEMSEKMFQIYWSYKTEKNILFSLDTFLLDDDCRDAFVFYVQQEKENPTGERNSAYERLVFYNHTNTDEFYEIMNEENIQAKREKLVYIWAMYFNEHSDFFIQKGNLENWTEFSDIMRSEGNEGFNKIMATKESVYGWLNKNCYIPFLSFFVKRTDNLLKGLKEKLAEEGEMMEEYDLKSHAFDQASVSRNKRHVSPYELSLSVFRSFIDFLATGDRMKTEGLFRVPGDAKVVNTMVDLFVSLSHPDCHITSLFDKVRDPGLKMLELLCHNKDSNAVIGPHEVVSTFKKLLLRLSPRLISRHLENDLAKAIIIKKSSPEDSDVFDLILDVAEQSAEDRVRMRYLCMILTFLRQIAAVPENKMDENALSICFVNLFFSERPNEARDMQTMHIRMFSRTSILKFLLNPDVELPMSYEIKKARKERRWDGLKPARIKSIQRGCEASSFSGSSHPELGFTLF